MVVMVAGYDRSVHSENIPGVGIAVSWLKRSGYDTIDMVGQDDKLWKQSISSSAFRDQALISDTINLSGCGTLFLVPGWEQYPEAHAMVAMAGAMHKHVAMLPEAAFKEP